ncbi:MAG: CapA family protein [Lachnospiraceae bacterium]|uniref:CapA family protein n=1 Tax=Candidatus Weimeria bifida TaxID=2599074 RepID=A0A6N7IX78_9FIRM|nr:CapA family protein [Candidatus Weimeria bifida]RRF97204.1 MAG: CapA family protein [Lachnospiraceae bacterium]
MIKKKIASVLVLSGLLIGLVNFSLPQSMVRAQAAKKAKTVKITISAAGDCTLGVDSRFNNRFNEKYNAKGSSYFLNKVKSVFSKDDLTIVNLEGTLTNSTNRARKKFTFKGKNEYTQILKKGSVEAVTVANNHSMDFGTQGFNDTKRAVRGAGIRCFGYDAISYKTIKGEKIAMIGVNALSSQGNKNAYVKSLINKAKKQKPNLIIIYFHWGIEGSSRPNSTQVQLAHNSINWGADLVLGSHPHVLQGIEKYKGKYIVYSMGNFCFGGNSNPRDKDTMIFQQTFTFKNKKLTSKKAAKVLPCSLSGVWNTNDFQPHLLTGSEKTRVRNKINARSSGMNTKIRQNGSLT